jgi:hypothetical protein
MERLHCRGGWSPPAEGLNLGSYVHGLHWSSLHGKHPSFSEIGAVLVANSGTLHIQNPQSPHRPVADGKSTQQRCKKKSSHAGDKD